MARLRVCSGSGAASGPAGGTTTAKRAIGAAGTGCRSPRQLRRPVAMAPAATAPARRYSYSYQPRMYRGMTMDRVLGTTPANRDAAAKARGRYQAPRDLLLCPGVPARPFGAWVDAREALSCEMLQKRAGCLTGHKALGRIAGDEEWAVGFFNCCRCASLRKNSSFSCTVAFCAGVCVGVCHGHGRCPDAGLERLARHASLSLSGSPLRLQVRPRNAGAIVVASRPGSGWPGPQPTRLNPLPSSWRWP